MRAAACAALALLGACAGPPPACPTPPGITRTFPRDEALAPAPPASTLAAAAAETKAAIARARAAPEDQGARRSVEIALAVELPLRVAGRDWAGVERLFAETRAIGIAPRGSGIELPARLVRVPRDIAAETRGLDGAALVLLHRLNSAGALSPEVTLLWSWRPLPAEPSARWIGAFDLPAPPPSPPLDGIRAAAIATTECLAARGDRGALMVRARWLRAGVVLPPDPAAARIIYAGLAQSTGGTTMIYVPPVRLGGAGTVMPVSTPVVPGLPLAERELAGMLIAGEGGPADVKRGCAILERLAPADPEWRRADPGRACLFDPSPPVAPTAPRP